MLQSNRCRSDQPTAASVQWDAVCLFNLCTTLGTLLATMASEALAAVTGRAAEEPVRTAVVAVVQRFELHLHQEKTTMDRGLEHWLVVCGAMLLAFSHLRFSRFPWDSEVPLHGHPPGDHQVDVRLQK